MLIVSGADLVGKSTFCKRCVELLQERGHQHMPMHLTRPPKNFDYFSGYIEKMSVNTVWDRFAIDSLAYRQCDDHECSMTPLKYDLVGAALLQHCALQVVLIGSPRDVTRRFEERGDPMYNLEHILKVNAAFAEMCDSPITVCREETYVNRIDMWGDVTDDITPVEVVNRYCERLAEFTELMA